MKDNSVKVLAYTLTHDKIAAEIDFVAKEFIRHEEGERRAENPYRDLLLDSQITEDGYFLRHASDNTGVDVYMRKTTIIPGRIFGATIDVTFTRVLIFRSTESNIRLINAGPVPTITQAAHTPSKLGQFCVSASFYTELCDKLRERKQTIELEKCFNDIIQDAEELQTELHKRRECIRDSEKSCDSDKDTETETDDESSLPPPPPPPMQLPQIPCVYVENLSDEDMSECDCGGKDSESSVLVKKLQTILEDEDEDEDDTFSSSEYDSEYTYEYTDSESYSNESDDSESEEIPVFDYYANVDTPTCLHLHSNNSKKLL